MEATVNNEDLPDWVRGWARMQQLSRKVRELRFKIYVLACMTIGFGAFGLVAAAKLAWWWAGPFPAAGFVVAAAALLDTSD